MFYVWDVEGVQKPFEPKSIKRSYRVEQVDAAKGVGAVGEQLTREQRLAAAYQDSAQAAQPRKKALVAGDIMSSSVFTISADVSLDEAQHIFSEKRFRHIPVAATSGSLVGILSDRILFKELSSGTDRSTPVGNIMTNSVITAQRNTEIRDIAKVMFDERNVSSLPTAYLWSINPFLKFL